MKQASLRMLLGAGSLDLASGKGMRAHWAAGRSHEQTEVGRQGQVDPRKMGMHMAACLQMPPLPRVQSTMVKCLISLQ